MVALLAEEIDYSWLRVHSRMDMYNTLDPVREFSNVENAPIELAPCRSGLFSLFFFSGERQGMLLLLLNYYQKYIPPSPSSDICR
jgi:hypothetical protein